MHELPNNIRYTTNPNSIKNLKVLLAMLVPLPPPSAVPLPRFAGQVLLQFQPLFSLQGNNQHPLILNGFYHYPICSFTHSQCQ